MKFRCPVCFYPDLPYVPADYNICPCCGIEFGNDDAEFSHRQLRGAWVAGGAQWFFGKPPEHWNPWLQLIQNYEYKFLPAVMAQFLLDVAMTQGEQDFRREERDWRATLVQD